MFAASHRDLASWAAAVPGLRNRIMHEAMANGAVYAPAGVSNHDSGVNRSGNSGGSSSSRQGDSNNHHEINQVNGISRDRGSSNCSNDRSGATSVVPYRAL